MEVLFFTDSPEVEKILSKNRLVFRGLRQLRSHLAGLTEPGLVYVDAASWKGSPENLIASAGKSKYAFLGIIDSNGSIKSPMPLMHRGIVDYIGQKDMAAELNRVHCAKVVAYIKRYRSDFRMPSPLTKKKTANGEEYIPVAGGWREVKLGKKHTFAIVFIELDEREEMEKRYGNKNLRNALLVFRKYVEKNVLAFGGKMWIWSQYGGILLFPFTAGECNAVLCAFRIVMYKFLHDVEESHFPNFISFRIAGHLGNLVYQEKNKGEVVSDSLNTIFHLGQEFAEPGCFYLTGHRSSS